MPKPRTVALAFPVAEPHLSRMLRGIVDYADRRGGWMFSFCPETSTDSLAGLNGWPGHGVIAVVNTAAEARALRETRLPVVNFSGMLRNPGLPRVMVDQEAIGRLAAEHLLDCGFRRFAYYGVKHAWSSRQRKAAFLEQVLDRGGECSVLEVASTIGRRGSWRDQQEPLEKWLRALVPPVGLMAFHDRRATMVLDACHRLGLRVPDDVAIIGSDNDEAICEICRPPLTSVARSDWQLGYEVAALLDRLMAHKRPPDGDILVPPAGVVQRRSTEVVAITDEHVAAAVRFVHDHLDEPFGMERLLPLTPLSRRWLTHRFTQCLGLTPHAFICRARVDRARQLLTGPKNLLLKKIAERCGFSEPRRFRLVFQRIAGTTPAEYRRLHRARS
jgi:LacI family transcriptional regulator